ncbi:AAA family ATPase [soil metagenome]
MLPLAGHAEIRAVLGRRAVSGTLPQSILLHGPAGVGKQRMGLWLAQLLVCQKPTHAAEPCGGCQPCQMAARLQHPDVHWFFPLPRPEGTSPERLREKLEGVRATELEARRADRLHVPAYERTPAHYLAAIQTLQRLAGSRPAMGRRKVFVVGEAELMVPQESSPEAANAFLKLLEEPPADTTLILTAERPGALLPTIVSRVLPVRVRPLSSAEVSAFLLESGAVQDAPEADRIAAASAGAIGRALRLLPAAGSASPLERQRQQGRALLETVLSSAAPVRFAAAHATAPAGARGEFLGLMDSFSVWLRDLLAVVSGAPEHLLHGGEADLLHRAAQRPGLHPLGIADALRRIDAAREMAEGNVNPQLILADLLRGVHSDIHAAPHV